MNTYKAEEDGMNTELNDLMDLIGLGYDDMYDEHYIFRFEQLRQFIQSNLSK